MKKIFFAILLFISVSGYGQATQWRLGIDSASGNPHLYHDTITPFSYVVHTVFNGFGAFVTLNTDSITEGSTNKFFSNTLARGAFSLTTTGTSGAATYNSTTGVWNIPQYAGTITGAGNLSPLFTTSTSGANITFSLTNAAAYTNFGNNTSSSAAPSYFTNNYGDSLRYSGDSTFRRVNGVFYYQYKLPLFSATQNGLVQSTTSTKNKILHADGNFYDTTAVSGGGGGQADSTYFWSRTLNVVTNPTDKLGSRNSAGLNFYTNNIRRVRIDSADGSLNIYPPSTNKPALNIYRGNSTSVIAMTITDNASDDIEFTGGGAAYIFKTGTSGAEVFRTSPVTPTGVITSNNPFLVTGNIQVKTIDPTGTNISPGIAIQSNSGAKRMSLDLDASANGVLYLHNTGFRVTHDNSVAGIGDWMQITPNLGGVVLKRKGTYPTEDTTSRFTVLSDTTNGQSPQGVIPAPVMSTSIRTGITSRINALTSLVGGSSYTNGTYSNVPVTGGTGSGATAQIIVTGNAVTTVTMQNKGINYSVNDVLSAAAANIGGTGSGFTATVQTLAATGKGLQVFDSSYMNLFVWNGTNWGCIPSTNYTAIAATYSILKTDAILEATSGTFTATLPTAVGFVGKKYTITNTGSGTLTLATTSSQKFINVTATPTSLSIAQFTNYTVISNGTDWIAYKMVN